MPTPTEAFDVMFEHYCIDPNDETACEKFMEKVYVWHPLVAEQISEFLLAAESTKFDYVEKVKELPPL